jgi:hypothetical protein
MRELVSGSYVCLDVNGDDNPDIVQNLIEKPVLPFEDGSFDTVLCLDALEQASVRHDLSESVGA